MPNASQRRFPIGAEIVSEGVSFRVCAPRRESVAIVLEGMKREIPLTREEAGYYSVITPLAKPGTKYRFRLDDDDFLYPDPASRFQPEGPHGPSQVVDPRSFDWSDSNWAGVELPGQVIYEFHIGTFTPQGTWNSACERLAHLADVGITVVEMMPVADFGGEFGWGYDGVNLFAPTRHYGTPDDFRRFVDCAHSHRIGVILDVVYNHFGPDGNYQAAFSRDYVTDLHKTDWGEAVNYDGKNSHIVREMMKANAAYWISEFHLDGLRFDATQNIYDSSDDHILAEMVAAAREAAGERSLLLCAENEEQRVRHLMPREAGGFGMDAMWNDDFHHAATVALTGRAEAYYCDFRGTPQEILSTIKWGYLFQGQQSTWQKRSRGTSSLEVDPKRFITYLENHDQVANWMGSRHRRHGAHPGCYRAMTAVMLLSPGTPMLFQGQEFGSSKPFYYFAGHHRELATLVDVGRKKFLSQFPSQSLPELQVRIPDPASPEAVEQSKLDWSECERHAATLELHRDLLRLRREDSVLSTQSSNLDGAVLSTDSFVVRFFADDDHDRLLLVNLGKDLDFTPCPEPLLAPPAGKEWSLSWSSEDPKYGGLGTAPAQTERGWFLSGFSAQLFVACTSQPS